MVPWGTEEGFIIKQQHHKAELISYVKPILSHHNLFHTPIEQHLYLMQASPIKKNIDPKTKTSATFMKISNGSRCTCSIIVVTIELYRRGQKSAPAFATEMTNVPSHLVTGYNCDTVE